MTPEIGTTYTVSITVTEQDLARAVGSGDLPVLATPRMAALMEQAAAALIAPVLGEGNTSVGVALAITHTAPTLPGATVSASATLTAVEGRKFAFDVRAWDARGDIGAGTHERVCVTADRFLQKAAARDRGE